MTIIGLTGGSGSGKSTIAANFESRGFLSLNCDTIAHDVMTCGKTAYYDILNDIPGSYLLSNGEIDRKKLGGVVFNNRNYLNRLNEITHHYVKQEIWRRIKENEHLFKHVIIDAPLLVEAGLHEQSDYVILAYCPYEIRLNRIILRDAITYEQASLRLKNQKPYEELLKYADYVIDTTGNTADIDAQVEIFILEKGLILTPA